MIYENITGGMCGDYHGLGQVCYLESEPRLNVPVHPAFVRKLNLFMYLNLYLVSLPCPNFMLFSAG